MGLMVQMSGYPRRRVTQINAQVAWLEGIAPEDQVVLPAGRPLEDEAAPGQRQRWGGGCHTLQGAGCRLGGQVRGSLVRSGKG
uniref:Ubiquitin-like domain-containing protein n=1 Tax=Sus scrofa TaxID=9823 RepID=A0A8D1Y5P4_PIG